MEKLRPTQKRKKRTESMEEEHKDLHPFSESDECWGARQDEVEDFTERYGDSDMRELSATARKGLL